MYFISSHSPSRSSALAVGALSLALLATGCSSHNSAADSSNDAASSSSVSSSSSHTPSSGASSHAPGTDGSTQDHNGNATDSSSESASPQAVTLDDESVKTTQELYSGYETALAEIKTVPIEQSDEDQETAEVEEGTPTDSLSAELSDSTKDSINKVATGPAAEEFSATALEYGINGWKQEGNSQIVGEPRLTKTEYKGRPAQRLEVCLDSSAVKVTDEAGNTRSSSTASHSLNIFTLIEEEGSWKIVTHDFPDNPDC